MCAVRMHLIFPETIVIGLYILSLIVWVYLYSNLCSGLQKTHLFCNRVRFGRSRSFKVIQGRWFQYQSNRKRVYDFLLARHCDCGPILHRFPYPSLIRRPRSLCSLWIFALKLTMRKLQSWGYPPGLYEYCVLRRMSEISEFTLCVPADLTRRFKGLSVDAGQTAFVTPI